MNYSFNDSLGFQVNKTANAMRNRFNNFLKPYGLTAEQYVILKAIDENPAITPTQLANILEKDKTTVTRIIATMVKNDFILRKKNETDRRSHSLIHSKKAVRIMAEIMPVTDVVIGKLRAQIEPDELQCFLKVLAQLRCIECFEDM